jgi:dihydroorotase
MLTHLPMKKFTLCEISRLLSTNPASRFHLKDRGQIKNAYHADLTFVDMNSQYQIGDANHSIQSRCGWSAYQDWSVRGDIVATMINGRFAFANQGYSKNLHSARVQFSR